MPISSALKIASVSVGVGGVATGAVLVSGGFLKSKEEKKKDESETTNTIESLIPKEKRLLDKDKDNAEKWKTNWDSFKNAYNEKDPKEIGNGWGFKDWSQEKTKEEATDEFKEKCINNSKGRVSREKDPLFVAIKDYCLTDKGND